MESRWQEKHNRAIKWKIAMRRIRLPLITVLGAFFVAFAGLPLLLNSIGQDGMYYAPAAAPLATPLPLPTEPQPLLAAPEETPEPTPTAAESAPAGALTVETPAGTPAATPDTSQYTLLEPGDESPVVAEIQMRLAALHYLDSDEPSEYFGPAIEAAVQRFQRTHHMKETGAADPLTQYILFSESAAPYLLEQGYSGEDVRSLQYRLAELGYYYDKTNGYFGVATVRALTAFQTKNGLPVDGRADFDTRDLIYSPDARPAIDPTPSPTPEPTRTPKPTATPKPSVTPKPSATPKSTPKQDTPAPTTTQNAWWGPVEPGPDPTPDAADPTPNAVISPTPQRTAAPTQNIEQTGSGVSAFIDAAKAQQGKPYVLGGDGPNAFDCSGLVYYSLRSAGVKIGRYSARNYAKIDEWETINGKGNLAVGDLLFYKSSGTSDTTITHVGIWLGGNQLIHASASRSSVVITTWSTWSDENFLFAKRVF